MQAAAELFTAHDYDDVTVARIAEVAGVSTRTFFSYFPSKEDVLFADTHTRLEQALQSMADRVPGESPVDLLVRAVRRALPASFSPGPGPEVSGSALPSLYGVRLRLNHSTPQIQAGAMRRLQEAQQLLSRALLAAFPERLTAVEAAALVGAFIGGISNAVIFCLAEDPDLPDTSQVAFEALEVVRRRLPELDRGAEG
ncbi:MAG: hypothetical protein QG608_2727 [Actinomycetota bacterium]|nr:hypothetical protein [Actinomycetota bacterium]